MRLIDADELKEEIQEYIECNRHLSGVFEIMKIIIDNAPTVSESEDK